MKKLKIALVGLGQRGRGLLSNIVNMEDIEIIAICDEYEDRNESTVKYINDNFDGDGMAFAKCYYETLAMSCDTDKFDVIAHIDLVTKNNEKGRFFDTNTKEYLGYAFDAIDALKGKISLFEVNTGAVARGYRTTHYPQMELLKRLRECGFGATLSTDCHNKAYLDFEFDKAAEYLREAGFKSKFVLTENGFEEVGL